MLPYLNIKNVGGYGYKNVTIPTEFGTDTYYIATQTSLGLPDSAVILGIAYRTSKDVALSAGTSINARPITGVQSFSQLTIRDIETKDIISSQPLYSDVNELFLDAGVIWFEPRRVDEIDWERSIIRVPQNYLPSVVDDEDFELVLIYWDERSSCNVFPAIENRTGFVTEGIRSKQIEIIERTGVQYYSLAKNSTIGIDDEAIIVGIGLSYFNKVSTTGTTLSSSAKAGFLNLKRRTTLFSDNFPIQIGQSINLPNFSNNYAKYIPIQPTKSRELDWEGSTLFISDIAEVVSGASDVLQIFYVQPIYK
jgi:hypothetical protein